MRTALLILVALALSAAAQVQNFQFPRMGGSYYASSFAHWQVTTSTPVSAPGYATFEFSPTTVTLVGNDRIQPATTGVPIQVVAGAASEVVTPTAVNCSALYCAVTAIFASAHPGGFTFASASGGLDEAIQAAAAQGGGTVIVGSDWTGSAAQITGAAGNASVAVLDTRAGASVRYAWTGSVYATALAVSASGRLQAASPNITPTSIEGVVYTDQFAGSTLDQQLSAAAAALPASGGTVVVPAGSWSIASSVTLPSKVTLVFAAGARLTLSAGASFDIQGAISAGRYAIFTGPGLVSFAGNGSLTAVYPEWWGAVADGSTDSTAAIQSALIASLTSPGSSHVTVALSAGTYVISSPLVPDPAQSDASAVTGFSLRGAGGGWAYNSPKMATTILASAAFSGTAMLNMQFSAADAINGLAITCTLATTPAGFDGLALGDPTLATTQSNHSVSDISVYGCNRGLVAQSSNLLRVSDSQFTGNTKGVWLTTTGDSTFIGNYVNTNSFSHQPAAYNDFTGAGIFIGSGSNNTSIIGGKIEWNAYGVLVYQSQGIHVGGVQFDTNYVHSVYVLEDTASDVASQNPRSISFVGCRFLGGGNQIAGTGDYLGTGVVVDEKQTGNRMDVLIAGNTFREAGIAAFDGNATVPVGPSANAIAATAPATGEVNVTVAGNDLNSAAGTNGVTAFDSTVQYSGNFGSLPLNNSGGAVFADIEAAPLTLGAGAILPSGQVLSASGASWNGGTVNAATLEQGGIGVALASQLPLSGSLAGSTLSLAADSCGDAVSTAVTGATTSMMVSASGAGALPSAGLTLQAAVTSANTVTVEYCNLTSVAIVPAALTIAVRVVQ